MPNSYFKNFPEISYLNYNAIDITASAKLVNKYINVPYIYYRMDVDNQERADQVAHKYYKDSYYTWLVYYSNKITDPYYDWFLSEEDFNTYVANKYNSIEEAKKRVLFFRTNWYSDEREISPDVYEAWFGTYKAPYNKYWNPRFDIESGEILSYVRKINDTVLNTNKIIKVNVSNNSIANSSKFAANTLVDIKNGTTQTATAEIKTSNTSVVYLERVIGSVANGSTICLDSNNSVYATINNFSNSYSAGADAWTKTQIADDEYIYWEPVYAYDYEIELNTLKRTINLVDETLAFDIYDKLREELDNGE